MQLRSRIIRWHIYAKNEELSSLFWSPFEKVKARKTSHIKHPYLHQLKDTKKNLNCMYNKPQFFRICIFFKNHDDGRCLSTLKANQHGRSKDCPPQTFCNSYWYGIKELSLSYHPIYMIIYISLKRRPNVKIAQGIQKLFGVIVSIESGVFIIL